MRRKSRKMGERLRGQVFAKKEDWVSHSIVVYQREREKERKK